MIERDIRKIERDRQNDRKRYRIIESDSQNFRKRHIEQYKETSVIIERDSKVQWQKERGEIETNKERVRVRIRYTKEVE